jgi:hypothetical protein
MDSTNMNLPPIPSDTITTVPPTTGDTMNTRNRDSAMTTPK